MTQHSEERLPESEPSTAGRSARILQFERPQSDLQRAIQQRAQEAIDLDRERTREVRRPQPLKWLAIVAVACIPVILTFGAIDGFLRVLHRVTETYKSTPATQPPPTSAPKASDPSGPGSSEPAANAPTSNEPGVVMLQSFDQPAASGKTQEEKPAAKPAEPVPPPQR